MVLADIINAVTGLFEDLGLAVWISASAVVGLAIYLFRRASKGAR